MSLSITRLLAVLLTLSFASSAIAGVYVGNPRQLTIASSEPDVTSAWGAETEVVFFDENGDFIQATTISDAELTDGIVVDMPDDATDAELHFVAPVTLCGEDEYGEFTDWVQPSPIDLDVADDATTVVDGDLPLSIMTHTGQ